MPPSSLAVQCLAVSNKEHPALLCQGVVQQLCRGEQERPSAGGEGSRACHGMILLPLRDMYYRQTPKKKKPQAVHSINSPLPLPPLLPLYHIIYVSYLCLYLHCQFLWAANQNFVVFKTIQKDLLFSMTLGTLIEDNWEYRTQHLGSIHPLLEHHQKVKNSGTFLNC